MSKEISEVSESVQSYLIPTMEKLCKILEDAKILVNNKIEEINKEINIKIENKFMLENKIREYNFHKLEKEKTESKLNWLKNKSYYFEKYEEDFLNNMKNKYSNNYSKINTILKQDIEKVKDRLALVLNEIETLKQSKKVLEKLYDDMKLQYK